MNLLEEKVFFFDLSRIRTLYPYQISEKVDGLGVLEQYRDKKYNLKEVNEIIADLIIKTPYIPNAMYLDVDVLFYDEEGVMNIHHSLTFHNHNFEDQERQEVQSILFLYE